MDQNLRTSICISIAAILVLIQPTTATFFRFENNLHFGQHVTQFTYFGDDINIYQQPSENNTTAPSYYFTPSAELNRSSIRYSHDNSNDRHQIAFKVDLWNETLKQVVASELSKWSGEKVEPFQVEPIPFERVILRTDHRMNRDVLEYLPTQDWMPYNSSVEFRLTCLHLTRCLETAEIWRESTFYSFDNFQIGYSIDAHNQIEKKEININHYEVIDANADIFKEISELFPKSDQESILITTDLAHEMLWKMVSSVLANLFQQESTAAVLPVSHQMIYDSLRTILFMTDPIKISQVEDDRWKRVYWKEPSVRPDVAVQLWNERVVSETESGNPDGSLNQTLRDELKLVNFDGSEFSLKPIEFHGLKFDFLFGNESAVLLTQVIVPYVSKLNWTGPIRNNFENFTPNLRTRDCRHQNELLSRLTTGQSLVVRLKSAMNGEYLFPAADKYLIYDRNRRTVFTWRDSDTATGKASLWKLKVTNESGLFYARLESVEYPNEFLYATGGDSIFSNSQRDVYTNKTDWYDLVDDESYRWLLDVNCDRTVEFPYQITLRSSKYFEFLKSVNFLRDSQRRPVVLHRTHSEDTRNTIEYLWKVTII